MKITEAKLRKFIRSRLQTRFRLLSENVSIRDIDLTVDTGGIDERYKKRVDVGSTSMKYIWWKNVGTDEEPVPVRIFEEINEDDDRYEYVFLPSSGWNKPGKNEVEIAVTAIPGKENISRNNPKIVKSGGKAHNALYALLDEWWKVVKLPGEASAGQDSEDEAEEKIGAAYSRGWKEGYQEYSNKHRKEASAWVVSIVMGPGTWERRSMWYSPSYNAFIKTTGATDEENYAARVGWWNGWSTAFKRSKAGKMVVRDGETPFKTAEILKDGEADPPASDHNSNKEAASLWLLDMRDWVDEIQELPGAPGDTSGEFGAFDEDDGYFWAPSGYTAGSKNQS